MFTRIKLERTASPLLALGMGAVLFSCDTSAGFAFQEPEISTPIQQAVIEAKGMEQAGDFQKAIQHFHKAKDQAKTEADRAEIALESGQTRFRQARRMNSTDVLKEAEKNFKQVTEMGAAPRQTSQAWNNLVSVYLALDKPQQAKQALEACAVNSVPESKRFVYYYNSARVQAALDNPHGAITEYHKSFLANPRFLKAAQQAWKIVDAHAKEDPRVSWAGYSFGLDLIQQGYPTLARNMAGQSAKNSPALKHSEAMMCLVIRSLAVSKFDEKTIRKEFDQPEFRNLFPPDALEELNRAFWGELSLDKVLSPEYRASRDFRWWLSSERNRRLRHDFSLLLRNIGDFYAGIGLHARQERVEKSQAEKGLIRYFLAWDIDEGNFQAAQNAAWVLATYYSRTEKGTEAIDRMSQLTKRLFNAKFRLYALPGKKPEDWERILRMHLLLGTIYEARKQWGSEERPQSAIYQWTRSFGS